MAATTTTTNQQRDARWQTLIGQARIWVRTIGRYGKYTYVDVTITGFLPTGWLLVVDTDGKRHRVREHNLRQSVAGATGATDWRATAPLRRDNRPFSIWAQE